MAIPPTPPYYYKSGKDTYHWELRCHKNNWKASSTKWVRTNTRPAGKEQCNHCKSV